MSEFFFRVDMELIGTQLQKPIAIFFTAKPSILEVINGKVQICNGKVSRDGRIPVKLYNLRREAYIQNLVNFFHLYSIKE